LQPKLLYIFVFIFVFKANAQDASFFKTIDSIQQFRKWSTNTNFDFETRLTYAKRASALSYKTGLDSVILSSNRKLANLYLTIDDHDNIININHKNSKLAQRLNDSLSLGMAYYNLGWALREKAQNDSAYYYYFRAQKTFHNLKNSQTEGEILLNIADIQELIKDYSGSDETAIKGINLIEALPENDRNLDTLWSLYNLLGVISTRLNQHDEALNNYNKCIEIAKKMSDPTPYILDSKNNIAYAYGQKGNLTKALSLYNELIHEKNLLKTNSELYAIALNNIAQTRFFLKDTDFIGIENQFIEAYRISDSLQYSDGIMVGMIDLSEFYNAIEKKDSALSLSKSAYKLGRASHSNDIILKSLLSMSELEKGDTGKAHLIEYIKLNDSLLNNERASRNKIARITFEVEQIEAENKKIHKERLLLLITVIALSLTLIIVYMSYIQRIKNKSLVFEKEQQKANEEVYSLMLKQQTKLEEVRFQERHRISEELHDGILNKLFGSRMGLEFLSPKFEGDANALKKYNDYINEIQGVELDIRDVSHELKNDILTSNSDFMFILTDYLKELSELHLFTFSIHSSDSIYWNSIEDKLKVNLYRIIQETLQNAIRHAEADTIDLNFSLQKGLLILTITDDGKGFNPKQQNKGIGLKNMKSRIHKFNGQFLIETRPNKGTTTTVTMPIRLV